MGAVERKASPDLAVVPETMKISPVEGTSLFNNLKNDLKCLCLYVGVGVCVLYVCV